MRDATLHNGLFAACTAAMLVVALAPRAQPSHVGDLQLQVAWLAQRESALGDWEAVQPPLREGDELQLTVLSSEDACIYVLDGKGQQLFPPPGMPPRVQGHWPYAIPGTHRTWRLDHADHDQLYLVAARHPLDHPAAHLHDSSSVESQADLILPLRDGRRGAAVTHVVHGTETLTDVFVAR
jgi:hypothetical protein